MKTSGNIHSSSIAQASKNQGSHLSGLSLNERLAGKRIQGSFPDDLKASTPSFDLIDINNHDGANASSIHVLHDVRTPDQHFRTGEQFDDPLLHLALEQYEKEILMNQKQGLQDNKTCLDKKLLEQLIFSNDFEHEFFIALTTNSSPYRYNDMLTLSFRTIRVVGKTTFLK
jgi:hypothetical protein